MSFFNQGTTPKLKFDGPSPILDHLVVLRLKILSVKREHGPQPDSRRLFTSPSAPVLYTDNTNCLDDIMDFSHSGFPNSQTGSFNSSKYSDRDSGVNSQENLSDMMDRDKFQDSRIVSNIFVRSR